MIMSRQREKKPSMQTILIANRGEIAVRLIRTVQRMGYRAAAVYSDIDANAPHVRMADCAVRIGPPLPRDSYLNIDAILAAASKQSADAIHPGYGFLAENAQFAQAVLDRGLIWIGPPPEAMRSMGNKAAAKRLLAGKSVPLLPGYHGAAQDDATLLAEAARVGLPLMIKAAAGGGGRGMRLVQQADELASALTRARSEAQQAFGSGDLILEGALLAPRHIEVQIFADTHGNVVHLGERDCSVQRRHQKIIEETPSPAVTSALRAQLGSTAVEVARACGYAGAGTVEFLLDADGSFWFMEMNTRLQVEHPVTEAITGIDLVEWQLRVAEGAALPLTQEQIDSRLAVGGHAIEVRLCAEDPAHDFLPQAGRVALWRAPLQIRVDHALEDGQAISPYYDSMAVKLIAHAATREEARRKLVQQLGDCILLGIPSNQDFLIEALSHPEFAEGRADTAFIAKHFAEREPHTADWPSMIMAATLLLACRPQPCCPQELLGWSSNASLEHDVELELDGVRCRFIARPEGAGKWLLRMQDRSAHATIERCTGNQLRMQLDGTPHAPAYAINGETIHFRHAGRNHALKDLTYRQADRKKDGVADGIVRAPMNGRVAMLHARQGQMISAGRPLIVLEAMKMEHTLAAPCSGILHLLHVEEGEQVAPGKIMAEIVNAPMKADGLHWITAAVR